MRLKSRRLGDVMLKSKREVQGQLCRCLSPSVNLTRSPASLVRRAFGDLNNSSAPTLAQATRQLLEQRQRFQAEVIHHRDSRTPSAGLPTPNCPLEMIK